MSFRLTEGFSFGGVLSKTVPPELSNEVTPWIPEKERNDRYWMEQALLTSMNSVGIANPNPAVGCVIVRNGVEIARGSTLAFGGKHAERVAIESISDKSLLQGACAYVTLEPCSHFGKQPPCTQTLIESGIARCVVALADPNPLVNWDGIRLLKDKGIEVCLGLCASEAMAWNYNFIMSQLLNRPIFAGKWAQTLDGHLADDEFTSKWISGSSSRAYTHWLRQKYDAILVGAGTVLRDIPELSVRSCSQPINRQPMKIVFDPKGRLLNCSEHIQKQLSEKFLASSTPLIIFTQEKFLVSTHNSWAESLKESEHILFLTFKEEDYFWEKIVDYLKSEVVKRHFGKPLQSILVEGGSKLLTQLLAANLLDICHVFIAPILIGGVANRIMNPLSLSLEETAFTSSKYAGGKLSLASQYKLVAQNRLGNDICMEFIPQYLAEELVRRNIFQ
ncbi:bifunctional diaminohydroxyphosphoribosylaminopyrimidine deaminase/5-amino-6-(5-phosphoribosylamino)uracil reductase RibD [Nostoc punctiforme FACHB-252]|jgi:diaminohydroxyphosphoribosylaminopyrimidine deaminase/5-amino-6-(5-phosphoribosylamino)uracil reductase|uniref:Riboflavin biosynthesis protein RibD n=1 Tax=Nostoc punctiforme FACHB-252 TaxID=1357509 RepID=A0ABR8H7N2_NOSPU|nr:bifunctional diaminohydroxyphosphoribosylaminopyrimidine deaminase/5-amino-6-(5-phosphoribosylamino)uracil reductase RibD [Nostoc punctiforme]MBD2611504.1 bifunctional diaminohydroxyphosphoribosylaminopyrimidine deaminase/5-amino-6-(5-phosphoribosylamino)uracil reductase RibD [Nostoc punctiforme FACHB-252]